MWSQDELINVLDPPLLSPSVKHLISPSRKTGLCDHIIQRIISQSPHVHAGAAFSSNMPHFHCINCRFPPHFSGGTVECLSVAKAAYMLMFGGCLKWGCNVQLHSIVKLSRYYSFRFVFNISLALTGQPRISKYGCGLTLVKGLPRVVLVLCSLSSNPVPNKAETCSPVI